MIFKLKKIEIQNVSENKIEIERSVKEKLKLKM